MLSSILSKIPPLRFFYDLGIKILALIGAFTAIPPLYDFVQSFFEPQEVIALIREANYQNRQYSSFIVDFRNPTSKPQSINEVYFLCHTQDDKTWYMTDFDYALAKMKSNDVFSKSFKLSPAESRTVSYKVLNTPKKLDHLCHKIQAAWTDAEFSSRKGDIISVQPSGTFQNQFILERPAMIKNGQTTTEK